MVAVWESDIYLYIRDVEFALKLSCRADISQFVWQLVPQEGPTVT